MTKRSSIRPGYQQVVADLAIPSTLAEFQPTVIGTPPLALEIDSSDIDIACSAFNLTRFQQVAGAAFGTQRKYRSRTSSPQGHPAVVISFHAFGWEIELFCQVIPIEEQWGFRHFRLEQRLLQLNSQLRSRIQHLKQKGLKTEPAFARALNLKGDPYFAILQLESKSDAQLLSLVRNVESPTNRSTPTE